jgi:hypothetical protein
VLEKSRVRGLEDAVQKLQFDQRNTKDFPFDRNDFAISTSETSTFDVCLVEIAKVRLDYISCCKKWGVEHRISSLNLAPSSSPA